MIQTFGIVISLRMATKPDLSHHSGNDLKIFVKNDRTLVYIFGILWAPKPRSKPCIDLFGMLEKAIGPKFKSDLFRSP